MKEILVIITGVNWLKNNKKQEKKLKEQKEEQQEMQKADHSKFEKAAEISQIVVSGLSLAVQIASTVRGQNSKSK